MKVEKSFELDEYYFDGKAKYMGIAPVRKYYANLQGDAQWSIENDSFDYAGTHCTGGKSGTHHLPDYAEILDFSLDEIYLHFEIYDHEIGAWFEADKKFLWRFENHRTFIKRFEKEHNEKIMEMLQEQEEKNECVVDSLSEY